jgi:hypothetical protein
VPLLKNADRAIIEPEKLRDYLLDPGNAQNGGKAEALFRMGYTRENWQRLESDLRDQHLILEATFDDVTIYGIQYVVVAPINGPARRANMKSVWQYDVGSEVPRLITAYPQQ